MSTLTRLALLFGLRVAPTAAIAPIRSHCGERELCAGTAFLGAPATPIAKLSPEDALRCFGVRQASQEA